MKHVFGDKQRRFSIRKLTVGIASVAIGLVFVNDVTGMSRVEASLSVDDSNYINQTAPHNGALVEYIRQALETISKAADSTVLPTSIQNLKNKIQSVSTKNESDYTESAWQEFQGKLTTAKSKLEEAEKVYNKAVSIKPNASSYETTINELITSYPEYSTVVIKVRDGETTEAAENRHLTNIRRINQVLTAKYAELRETAQLVKVVLPPVGEDIAAQQLNIITSAEKILEFNKKEATVAQAQHADLIAGLFEDNKVVLSGTSNLRGTITPEDQTKIKAFLEAYNPSVGETAVFTTYAGDLEYRFNNDGTITITYKEDNSSDTVPLSSFAKGGATQTDSPAATYSVTYNYVSGTPDKTLPSSITAPAVVNDKHTGDVVASPSGQTDVEDTANQGTWHFNSWDKASVTIGTANETVTGTWNFVPTPPAATYTVTYNYVSGTPDKTLPSSITAPAVVSDKHTGDVVASPSGQTDVEDAANQGTWHFNGWDKASVTIGTANETVTGTWNFVPTPPAATYTVTYNYVSGTPDKTLPSSITVPAVVNDKHTGDVVASPTDQTDVEDAANQGTWHFNGWDKASVTIGTANETVTGTWNFVPTPPAATYTVTYNYVSGTPDKTLPSSITVPAVVNDKHTGDVVASPTDQTDVEDAANQGTWHFNGWDKASVTIGTANETVTGTWNFVPTPPAATYTVTYNYVSGTPDKTLPSSITVPAVVNDKHTGDVVASPTDQTDVEDAANQGTWHFNGWDKASVTIGTANETVTGTWNFVPTPPAATYSVTYNYVSGTPDKTLPSSITVPAVVSDKHTGDVVASPTGQTDVEDAANQGTWHFNGWDKASVTIGTANETVTGTWNFVPTPPAATYTVTYNYVSGTPDKTLPSSITAPAVVSDKHTGDVVASPTGQTDVEDAANQGTWHFNGWDKASVTIGTSDETVTGTWNFVPTPPAATYTVTYNYVSGAPDKTLPSSITAPAVVSDKHTGDVVASPTGQTDVEDAANQGTWHFNGWDKASVTIGTANETVTGTWIFTATPGENPSTTPGTATPGENPSTTPGTTTPGENPSTTPGTTTPGENPSTTPGTTTPGENPSTTPGTATPGENPSTTPGTTTPGENPSTTPGTTTPGENPSTTPGTTTPGENPSTTPGTTTPGENPSTTPGTTTPGENPSTTPGTTTPGEKPSTTPGTTTPGENPSTTPGTTTPGENPSTTPGTTTPGENPSTTPGTTTPGENPSTTPGTTTPGENPSTTPGTTTPGENPSTTPGTATPGENPSTTPGTTTPGENPSTTPGTTTPGENPSTTPGTTTPGENPSTTPGTATPGENPSTTPGTTTPGENPSTTPGTATPGENPSTTPGTTTPGENPSTTPGTTIPGENPSTTPGTTTPGENPSTTPGTTTPGENPSTTPGTTTPGENPSTTPGTTTPGENPSTTPGTTTPGENPSTTPGTTTPGENPSTTPGTTTPGENPSTTPGTTTPGENPSTTPGTTTPGENPSTTPGTTTPGENPSTTPGTTTPGENPSTTPGTTTPGENPSTTPGTTTPGENPSTTPGTTTPGGNPGATPDTTTPGENPSTIPDLVTPRTTYLYVTSKEDKTLPNSVVEGWSKKDGHWLYQLEDGSHIVNEWNQINGTWYHFDNSGLMQTGWIKENGTWYYLNDSGAMQTGWVKDKGTWYYLNNSGAMQTGWVKDKGIWYYLNNSGAMQTGWVKENGTWYYLNQSGSMETGWFMVSDKWYYANESGALAINTTTPDGYTVNADGEWVE